MGHCTKFGLYLATHNKLSRWLILFTLNFKIANILKAFFSTQLSCTYILFAPIPSLALFIPNVKVYPLLECKKEINTHYANMKHFVLPTIYLLFFTPRDVKFM